MMGSTYDAFQARYPAVAAEQHTNAPIQTSGNSNVVTNAISSPLTVHQIARCFVYRYYSSLFRDCNLLYLLYDKDSQVNRLVEKGASLQFWKACGRMEISDKLKNQLKERTRARIRIIEPQKSINDDIFVFIAGFLQAENQAEREFVQSVYLARQDMSELGWYIKNEVFCFVDCLANDDFVEADVQPQHVAESAPAPSGSNKSSNAATSAGGPLVGNNTESSATTRSVVSAAPASYEEVQKSAYETQVVQEQKHAVHLDHNSGAGISEVTDSFIPSPTDSAKASEEFSEPSAVADVGTGSKASWQDVGNQWETHGVVERASDPNWPKLGEPAAISNEQNSAEVQNDSVAYEESTFAYTLMHNVQGRNVSNIQRGYAVSPSEAENASSRNTLTTKEQLNDERKTGGSADGIEPSVENAKTERWIHLIGLPNSFSVDVIKRGIKNSLAKCNEGHAVEVLTPYVELNNQLSVNYLITQGQIWISGTKVKVVSGSPNFNRSRASNREHQNDRDRRIKGGSNLSNGAGTYKGTRNFPGGKHPRNPQSDDNASRNNRGMQRQGNHYGEEKGENRQGGGGERRGRINNNFAGNGRQPSSRKNANVGSSTVGQVTPAQAAVTPGVKSRG